MFRRSSAVEQLTVNQLVVGSIPTAGANKNKHLGDTAAQCELLKHSISTVFAFGAVFRGITCSIPAPKGRASGDRKASRGR